MRQAKTGFVFGNVIAKFAQFLRNVGSRDSGRKGGGGGGGGEFLGFKPPTNKGRVVNLHESKQTNTVELTNVSHFVAGFFNFLK